MNDAADTPEPPVRPSLRRIGQVTADSLSARWPTARAGKKAERRAWWLVDALAARGLLPDSTDADRMGVDLEWWAERDDERSRVLPLVIVAAQVTASSTRQGYNASVSVRGGRWASFDIDAIGDRNAMIALIEKALESRAP